MHNTNLIRVFYVKKFKNYPEVMNLLTFRKMMGGIGDSFARRLIREDRVQHIYIKPHYWIYKKSVIEYLLSDDYANRRLRVRV